MIQNNFSIIFLGTPAFAVPFLQALVAVDLKPVLVITRPDQPAGRKQQLEPPAVKMPALLEHITVKQPATKKELHEIIEQAQPTVGVLVAYGTIIPEKTLAIPRFGFVNVHPSLLPKYRGSAPVQTAILRGDEFSGVTLIKLDPEMDHGPIIAQEQLPILATDTNATLHDRLAILGADLLIDALPKYLRGEITPQSQDESAVTITKEIQRADGLIDWSKSAVELDRQFRAFFPWPGVFSHWQGKRLKLANLSLLAGNFGAQRPPGMVFLGPNNSLAVACGQGAIKLERLQLAGKNEIGAVDFLRGAESFVGSRLE